MAATVLGGICTSVTHFNAFTHSPHPGLSADACDSLAAACDHIVHAFSATHAPVFVPARRDMERNIDILRRRAAGVRAFGDTQSIARLVELGKDGSATESLLWLGRSLEFYSAMLEELIAQPHHGSAECMRAAYARTLAHHHNFVVRGLASIAFTAVPGRASLVEMWGSATAMQHLATAVHGAHVRTAAIIKAMQ